MGLKIPLALEIKELNIEELANVDYIYISPNLFGLLFGKIILNEVKVSKPQINWQRGLPADEAVKEVAKNEQVNNTEVALAQTKEILNPSKVENKLSAPIIIKSLSVKDGIINFTDRAISESGIQITLREVLFNVDNLYLFPKSVLTNFNLTAKIPWQKDSNVGTVYVSGWVNLYKKDMQARLEVEGIDGVYLYPYYSNWVDLENARIEEASLNFISDIQGQSNDIVAKCRLELTDIKFKPRPPEQPEHKAEKITTVVLGIFRALNQGKIVLNFTIRTKLDNPEFKFDSISKAVDETINQAIKTDKVKIEDVALLPARFFEGMASKASGATKAIINGAVSVGKSLKDAILGALGTEKEQEEASTQKEDFIQN